MKDTQYFSQPIAPHFLQQNLIYPIDSILDRPRCHAASIAYKPEEDDIITLFCAWFAGVGNGRRGVAIMFSEITYHSNSDLSQIKMNYSIPRVIASHPDRACHNPVFFLNPEQILHLWYAAFFPKATGKKDSNRNIYHKTSADYGKTWSEPEVFSDRPGLWVKNPPIILKNGTLLLPMSDETTYNPTIKTDWSSRFALSSDFGQTWSFSSLYSIRKGMIQPSVVQFSDGELYCLNRSRTKHLVEMKSTDNALTWSTPANSQIPNNNDGICMILRKNGDLVLAYNPTTKAQSPLSIALSHDRGLHWARIFDLQTEPHQEFLYPTLLEAPDNLIHVVYTYKRRSIAHDVFSLDDDKGK